MKKIKVKKNDKVLAIDFYANLLKDNILYKLCKEFNLTEIYIEIYSIDTRHKNFYESLLAINKNYLTYFAEKSGVQDIFIKTTVVELSKIMDLLSEFVFEDLIIWNCYTNWRKYLEDKTTKVPYFTIKRGEFKDDSNFYLNFNPYEGQKVEIICDLIYNKQELFERLTELVK